MAVSVVLNSTTYSIPEPGDSGWGQDLTDYFVSLSTGVLQKAGGAFSLTAEVDFGATYGLKGLYYKSRSANASTTGVLRLANSDGIGWRNSLNSSDLLLKPSTDGLLQYNSVDLVDLSTAQTLTNKTITGTFTGNLTGNISGNASGTAANITGIAAIANGGTGAATAALAKQNLGAQDTFNGLEDPTKFSFTYDSANRQLTVTYASGAVVWVNGVRYEKSGSEVTTAHANTTALYFFYYNSSGALVASNVAWNILTTAQLALVFYNSSLATGIIYDERHAGPTGMSAGAHKWAHTTIGTRLLSGIVASGYTLNTAGDAALSYAVSSGSIADEDIVLSTGALSDGGPYRIFYRTGTDVENAWVWDDTSTIGILASGSANPYYNQNNAGTWQLTEVAAENRWVNYYVLAYTALSAPQVVVAMGQNVYTSLASAQAATVSTDLAGLSYLTSEGVVVYRMTYQRATAASPTKARLVDVSRIASSIVVSGSSVPSVSADIATDTSAFNGRLTVNDDTVQKALNTLDDNVTSIALGGTGQTTANAALNALLPSQTGNSGKTLTTDGTNSSWVSTQGGSVTSVTFTGDGTVLSSTPSSAVTSSGTLSATLNTQSAGTFLAGPTSGSAAAPTFRALQPPTIQKFTSGSGTYTKPDGVLYIRVKAVGGGGGGGAGGTAVPTNAATAGGNTTFGTTLLVANGGSGAGTAAGGAGGSSSLGTGPIGIALTGAAGQGNYYTATSGAQMGGSNGGSTPFGGAGGGAQAGGVNGGSAQANTGSGGGGGSANGASTAASGAGGGAGGYLDAIITSPSATYSYAVGTSGTGAKGGLANGGQGGNGAAGLIIVEEHYQ